MKKLEREFWEIEIKITDKVSNLLSTYLKEKAIYEGHKVSLLEQPEYFGCWTITNNTRQIIYDGKDNWLIMKLKESEENWINETIIKLNGINPEKISQLYYWLIESIDQKSIFSK